ncbi:MAG TPA: hypothetical protein VF342_02285 [Alphaproteobacteria bacterium]
MAASPMLVIFDCDDVLIDRETVACRVDAECLSRVGFAITAGEIMTDDVGVGSEVTFADLEARKAMPLPARLSCSTIGATSLA